MTTRLTPRPATTRTTRTAAALLAGTLLLAGCGTDARPDDGATPAPAPGEGLAPPPGFPEEFPPAPDGAQVVMTLLSESASIDPFGEDQGTQIGWTYEFETGDGSAEEAERVLQYYRDELPRAGWDIENEDEQPGANPPHTRLMIFGHDYWLATVVVARPEGAVRTTVNVSDLSTDRTPYHEHPPMITLPEVAAGLAGDLPAGARRDQLQVRAQPDQPTEVRIDFHLLDDAGPDNGWAVLESLADHYRGTLAAAGWTLTRDEPDHDTIEGEHFTTEVEIRDLEFEGPDGATARVYARQEVHEAVGPDRVHGSLTLLLPG